MNARVSVCLLWAVIAVAALVACRSESGPSRFPHQLHLASIACGAPGKSTCLSCVSCHDVATHDSGQRMPGAALCARCHRDASAVKAVLAVAPVRPSGEISIDHDKHLAMPEIRGQCLPCHAGVVDEKRSPLPPMSQCFNCHEHAEQWSRGECTPCHEPEKLRRTLPRTFLRHDTAFLRHHGSALAEPRQAQLCQSCHTQAQCQSCHDVTQDLTVEVRRPEKIESGQVHRGDFMVRHALEARSQPSRCLSCHTVQGCDSCHAARGVSANVVNPSNPHPPGWVGSNTSSSNFHGTSARRDILSCASCHEAGPATNCIRCHKVGAYGGNPHPRGWKSARGEDSQMCRYCHE
jgi:cytochrome c7-like protein